MITSDFKNILNLARKLANLILTGKEVENADTQDLFEGEDQTYVAESLTDKKLMEQRETLRKRIEEGKAKEWTRLWASVVPGNSFLYLKSFGKIAAIFVVILCLAYIYKNVDLSQKEIGQGARITNSDVTLKLENGDVMVLSPTGKKKIIDKEGKVLGTKKGSEINYALSSNPDTKDEVLTYNELMVPYGRTFQLVLSDGTQVYLNSGTLLKYPIKFIKGEGHKREIFLDGEAYFEVSKDAEHPFIVHADNLNVRVLGTKFVVSSYPEDQEINTILVEGCVGLSKSGQEFDKEHSAVLIPEHKAAWNKKGRTISIEKVDTDIYTGWMNGQLIFDEKPFSDIVIILERHYNVSIINRNRSLAEKKFTARFDSESIDEVLTAFAKNYSFAYKIEKDEIIIN